MLEFFKFQNTDPLWVLAKVFLYEILTNFEQYLSVNNGLFKLGIVRKKIRKVSPKYGIFQISEHKSLMSIGQRVSLWNFELFLYIKYGLFKLWVVKNGKRN